MAWLDEDNSYNTNTLHTLYTPTLRYPSNDTLPYVSGQEFYNNVEVDATEFRINKDPVREVDWIAKIECYTHTYGADGIDNDIIPNESEQVFLRSDWDDIRKTHLTS